MLSREIGKRLIIMTRPLIHVDTMRRWRALAVERGVAGGWCAGLCWEAA